MAHALTDTSAFTTSVTVPDDGDDLDAASVQVGFQALANRTKFLKDQLTGAQPTGNLDINGYVDIDLDLSIGGDIEGLGEINTQGSMYAQIEILCDGNIVAVGALQGAAATIGAGGITSAGSINSSGSIAATGNANIGGGVFATGNLAVGGTSTLTGNIQGNGNLDILGIAQFQSGWRRRMRQMPDNSVTTIPGKDIDFLTAAPGGLTANRQVAISDTSAQEGMSFIACNRSSFNMTLVLSGGSTTLTPGATAIVGVVYGASVFSILASWG